MIYALSTSQLADHPVLQEAIQGLRAQIVTEAAKGGGADDRDRPDPFDDGDAVHLLCMRNGRLAGFLRLLPTTRPHMLSEKLADLCTVQPPRDAAIWEIAGQGVAPAFRDGRRGVSRIGLELVAGLLEWGLDNGVTGFVIEMETIWILRAMQLGFHAQPLGPPRQFARRRLAATLLGFDGSALEAVRGRRNHHAPVLSRQMPSAFGYMQAS